MNQVVIELLKENQEKEQEIIALKLQLAKQEEKIDILSSRLSSRCQVENKYVGEKKNETAPATILWLEIHLLNPLIKLQNGSRHEG